MYKFCIFSYLLVPICLDVMYSVIVMILVVEKQGSLLIKTVDPTEQTDLVYYDKRLFFLLIPFFYFIENDVS